MRDLQTMSINGLARYQTSSFLQEGVIVENTNSMNPVGIQRTIRHGRTEVSLWSFSELPHIEDTLMANFHFDSHFVEITRVDKHHLFDNLSADDFRKV